MNKYQTKLNRRVVVVITTVQPQQSLNSSSGQFKSCSRYVGGFPP